MKNIIIWAGNHKLIAQVVLTLLLFAIGILSFLFGISASLSGLEVGPFPFAILLASLFLPIIILYPSRRELKKIGVSRNYIRKWKIYDFALVFILAASFFFTGNQLNHKPLHELSGIQLLNSATEIPVFYKIGNIQTEKPSLKGKIRGFFQKLQDRVVAFTKAMKEKDHTGNRALNTLLIILMYISYLVLIVYAAAFSCSLSCNGMAVAAAFVILSAHVILLTGMFFGIRALLKQRQKWASKKWSKSELYWRTSLATLGAFLSPLLLLIVS